MTAKPLPTGVAVPKIVEGGQKTTLASGQPGKLVNENDSLAFHPGGLVEAMSQQFESFEPRCPWKPVRYPEPAFLQHARLPVRFWP
jgi:hypothetical protein